MRTRRQCVLVVVVLASVGIPCVVLGMTRGRGSHSGDGACGPVMGARERVHGVGYMRDAIDASSGPRFAAAVRVGYREEVERLLDEGADPNMPGHRGWRALHCAATSADWRMVSLLLARGADVSACTDASRSALHSAAVHQATEESGPCDGRGIEMLVAAGHDVDVRDQRGRTPLYAAAHMGRTEHVAALVRLGADVHALNDAGLTPLDIARKEGWTETAEVLRSLGAVE